MTSMSSLNTYGHLWLLSFHHILQGTGKRGFLVNLVFPVFCFFQENHKISLNVAPCSIAAGFMYFLRFLLMTMMIAGMMTITIIMSSWLSLTKCPFGSATKICQLFVTACQRSVKLLDIGDASGSRVRLPADWLQFSNVIIIISMICCTMSHKPQYSGLQVKQVKWISSELV